MKNIIKTLLIVMTLALVVVAFSACETECTHAGTLTMIPSVPSTCTEEGLTVGVQCTACNAVIKAQEVAPALGHDLTHYDAVAPTCTEDGRTAGDVCGREICDYTSGLETIPALGHNVVVAGYDEEGYMLLACSNEGCTAKGKQVGLPEAVITDLTGNLSEDAPALTFALNFAIAEMTEARKNLLLTVYGDCYVDYVLKVEGFEGETVTFNANGGANGYLAGQYDTYNTGWLNVPDGNVALNNGESFYIMEYAAQALEQPGLRITFNDVVTFVKDFDCGIFFEEEFISANPELKVTLQLVMYTLDENGEKEVETLAERVFTLTEAAE